MSDFPKHPSTMVAKYGPYRCQLCNMLVGLRFMDVEEHFFLYHIEMEEAQEANEFLLNPDNNHIGQSSVEGYQQILRAPICWTKNHFLPLELPDNGIIQCTDCNINLFVMETQQPKHPNVFVKKDYLQKLKPIKGGIGESLLKKMGWKEGHGLGKNEDGILSPVAFKFRSESDRRGLVADEETKSAKKKKKKAKKVTAMVHQVPNNKKTGNPLKDVKEIENGVQNLSLSFFNYVGALHNYCLKLKYKRPIFAVHSQSGLPHRVAYTMKVFVNGEWYVPTEFMGSKKRANQVAAKYCLEKLGWKLSRQQRRRAKKRIAKKTLTGQSDKVKNIVAASQTSCPTCMFKPTMEDASTQTEE